MADEAPAADSDSTRAYLASTFGITDAGKPPVVEQKPDDDDKKREQTIEELRAKKGEIEEQHAARIQARMERIEGYLQAPPPQVRGPNLQNISPPPKDDYQNIFKVASAPLIFMTMFGSLISRQHGMGAMAAATGFMQGFREGDKERMENNRAKWNDHMKAVIEQNRIENERYQAVWNNAQLSERDKLAKISALASLNRDEYTLSALRTGKLDEALKFQEDRAKMAEKAKTDLEKVKLKQSFPYGSINRALYERAVEQFTQDHSRQPTLEEARAIRDGIAAPRASEAHQRAQQAQGLIDQLADGKDVSYGGVKISPKDFENFNNKTFVDRSVMSAKEKMIERLMTEASKSTQPPAFSPFGEPPAAPAQPPGQVQPVPAGLPGATGHPMAPVAGPTAGPPAAVVSPPAPAAAPVAPAGASPPMLAPALPEAPFSMPVPAENAQDPDGTRYYDQETQRVLIKRGGSLVELTGPDAAEEARAAAAATIRRRVVR